MAQLAGFDLLKPDLRKRAGVFHTVTPVPPSPSCAGPKSKRWDGGDRGGRGSCSFFAEERGARGEESGRGPPVSLAVRHRPCEGGQTPERWW